MQLKSNGEETVALTLVIRSEKAIWERTSGATSALKEDYWVTTKEGKKKEGMKPGSSAGTNCWKKGNGEGSLFSSDAKVRPSDHGQRMMKLPEGGKKASNRGTEKIRSNVFLTGRTRKDPPLRKSGFVKGFGRPCR